MGKLRMLALDLDGTLLREDKTISQPTRKMLTALHQAGVEIAFVTGRMYHFTVPIQDLLGFPVHYICTDGAFFQPRGWEAPHLKTVAPAVTKTVLSSLADELDGVYLFSNDRIHCFTATPDPTIFSWGFDLQADPDRKLDPPVNQVEQIVIYEARAKIRGIQKALGMMFPGLDQEIQPSFKSGYEYLIIRPQGVDKGSGLTRLAEILGVKTTETIAFGDWLNDLALFRDAGLSIAPANAVPEVKAKATIVSRYTNEQDFIVRELERLFQEGKMVV
ncbi:HAD family hydrolase [Capillibacterium thermochitinicola]|uniref:HAD family phosphatase n=1 Tax=Capillibacterium thermochitinicola TaxID=2699427 RepID=A0A8J6I1C1_9FIRM|nr:HAD family hydrolase [Capillibacterium thermochitinicola]MBA2133178.1 HAD family phosphatase [Capillibacterium thermochitinicola]